MKVDEYLPKYGFLYLPENSTGVDGKIISVAELFEKYPDHELTDEQIDQLDAYDRFAFHTVLKYRTIDNIIPFLRENLDKYRVNEGDPLDWLYCTLQNVHNNPDNYKPELITIIEKSLVDWIAHFENIPLYIKQTDLLRPHKQDPEPDPEEPVHKPSSTKQFISDVLETLDKSIGWRYAFTNDTDYNTFLDLLTSYFEYAPYSIPQYTIKLKRDCKTRFAKALSPIHKTLSEKSLKSDIAFFKTDKGVKPF